MKETIVTESNYFPYVFGADEHKKPLFEFIQYLPYEFLDEYGLIATTPLDIRNTAAGYFKYTSDLVVHGTLEHWISTIDDMKTLLDDPRDDCDGMSIFVASWLHSVGNQNVRLCIGALDSDRMNHMFVTVVEGLDHYLIEVTGDRMINVLPNLSSNPKYKLFYSASATTRMVYSHV